MSPDPSAIARILRAILAEPPASRTPIRLAGLIANSNFSPPLLLHSNWTDPVITCVRGLLANQPEHVRVRFSGLSALRCGMWAVLGDNPNQEFADVFHVSFAGTVLRLLRIKEARHEVSARSLEKATDHAIAVSGNGSLS